MPRWTDSQIAQSCRLTRSQQLGGVAGVEVRVASHGVPGEEQEAVDPGPVDRLRPQHEGRDVVGRAGEHQVGVDQLALVAGALRLVQAGQRRPGRGAAQREGPGPLAVRDAVLPRQAGAAAGERRDQPAQLGVDRPAVVALVVVLGDDLPVGRRRRRTGEAGDQVAPSRSCPATTVALATPSASGSVTAVRHTKTKPSQASTATGCRENAAGSTSTPSVCGARSSAPASE